MEQAFIEKMQVALTEQKEQILKSLADKHSEYKKMVESGEPGDEVDIASDVIDGALLESLGAQDANRLTMINNALDRIQQGKYGICLKCHKEIPVERLEAIPYAFMCITCQSENERRNR
ncbi:TraR/DksA family transcriptional regulator [uncultured Treponema sp.]|uniref:TraR/DksA family transcriptional regulator n=1 Tax=uncultured Treponema sp. TaxID=162155 RepID=UPI0025F32F1F|nr:TraR/DksA family transcriptional regulator [uncultured Treponema sp.]